MELLHYKCKVIIIRFLLTTGRQYPYFIAVTHRADDGSTSCLFILIIQKDTQLWHTHCFLAVETGLNQLHTTKTHIVSKCVLIRGHLDGVSDEAEDGSNPQQNGETSKQLLAELNPLRCGLGRPKLIGAVTLQDLLGTLNSVALQVKGYFTS